MKEKIRLITVLLVLMLVISFFAPAIKVIATSYGTENYELSFGFVVNPNETAEFEVNEVTINGYNYANNNDVFKSTDGIYNGVVKIKSNNGKEPDIIFGGNVSNAVSNINSSEPVNGVYTFTFTFDVNDVTDTQFNNFVGVNIEEKGSNVGGGNSDPVQIPNGTLVTGNFSYSNSGDGDPVDIWLNQTEIGVGEPPAATKDYYYDTSTGKVTFKLATFINNRMTSVKINDVDYTNKLPKNKTEWLLANEGQIDAVEITVPYSSTYNIVTTTTKNFEMSVGNFLWSYMDKDKGTDDYVGNGKLQFVSLVFNEKTYNSLTELKAENKSYLDWNENKNEGGAVLPAESKLTVKLIPNSGYQLTAFTCNGQEVKPQEEVGTYTFEIPSGNFHLGATFSKVDDVVKASAKKVESGTIVLGGSETSMSNGTARLDVNDVTLDEEKINNFKNAANEYKIANYLEISLYNTVYKGSAESSWDTQVDDLNNEATITLKLDEGVDGDTIVIVHEKHDGTYEIIPCEYDPETHTITFKTSSFSNYAIATKTNTTQETTEVSNTSNNPKTGDNIMVFVIIFVVTVVGALATFIISKKMNNKKTNK